MAPWTVLRLGIGLIPGAFIAVFLLSWNVVQAGTPVLSKNAVTPAEMQRGGLLFRTDRPGAFLPAPDLATEAHIRINGMVARVRVVQHFLNPHDEWQEGVYVFPLPDNAAVDHVRLLVGERVIVGEIRERQEAKRTYEKARAAGQRAALVEQERPNMFTASVANIGPGERITVEIRYHQTLRYDDGAFRLRFPLVVGPRYIPGTEPEIGLVNAVVITEPPQVPDADRITPPIRHPSQGKGNPVQMRIELNPGFEVAEITSPYHAIKTTGSAEEGFTITLDGDAVPADRDFELVWKPRPGDTPVAAVFTEEEGDGTYLLMMVTPPETEGAPKDQGLPREVIFVIDTSGSMAGTSMKQAKLALGMAIKRLHPRDRFNIIQFNSVTSSLFAAPKAADPSAVRRALAYTAYLNAEGGTEMLPALRKALDGKKDAGRIRQVVFITDGDVGNEPELFREVTGRLGDSRLFTIGIGSAPNGYFMREAANLGRGTFTYIGSVDEVQEKMEALFAKLERPALTDLRLTFTDGMTAEVFPQPLPDLYYGEPLVIAALVDRPGGEVVIEGRMGRKPWRTAVSLTSPRPAPGIAKVWARRKIQALSDAVHYGADRQAVQEAVTRVALTHHLISRYTSLVAVDVTPVRPENVSIAKRDVPINLPHGWVYGKVTGEKPTGAPQPARFQAGLLRDAAYALPQTATPAQLKMLLGALALVLSGLTLWLYRRRA
jgi:Ca-activated chloride channel family protein